MFHFGDAYNNISLFSIIAFHPLKAPNCVPSSSLIIKFSYTFISMSESLVYCSSINTSCLFSNTLMIGV